VFGEEQWRQWAAGAHPVDLAAAVVQSSSVDAMLRRRLNPLARATLAVAERLLPHGEAARVVYASRHGDLRRTLDLLESIAEEQPLSPTAFSLSVHNALPGLWSMLRGDRSAGLALAAGEESFCWGLVEAMAQALAFPQERVMLLYADEPLPGPYASFETQNAPPLAVGLIFGASAPQALELTWRTQPRAGTGVAAWAFLKSWFGPESRGQWQASNRCWGWGVQ
jgi:hypothetical protein